jgi:mono/diheme cytochrome c family protein
MRTATLAMAAVAGATVLSGCHVDMWQQPRVNPLSKSDFHADQAGSRPVVEGTVVRGRAEHTEPLHTALQDGKPIPMIPPVVVREFGGPTKMLARGEDRYNVYCSPCHGALGNGNGFIALRGLGYWQKLPANLRQDRLKDLPDGELFRTISQGKGAMYGYASRIPESSDRWAVVAYVRALQSAPLEKAATVPAAEHAEGGSH